jgi:ABC-type uncharacterized transport system involved in gliding motility auxiliary subunit
VTEAGVYTLAPQSKQVVESLQQDLQMTAFVEGGQDAQLEGLLGSYQYAAPAHVKFRLVDPDKEPVLVEQMKITALRSVHLQYGNESFVVTTPSEETVTNGFIRVTGTTKRRRVLHRRPRRGRPAEPAGREGYASAKLALEQENYEVKSLVLLEQIPDDASVVVVAGPERPLSPQEIATLDGWRSAAGALRDGRAARGQRRGPTKLLADWGAKLGNDIVIDRSSASSRARASGRSRSRNIYGAHPITQNFHDYTTYPETRTVEPDAAGKKGIQATSLVKTAASSRALTKVDELFTKGTATIDEGDRRARSRSRSRSRRSSPTWRAAACRGGGRRRPSRPGWSSSARRASRGTRSSPSSA